jgi:nucleoside-diphosphate-sugar epimerase
MSKMRTIAITGSNGFIGKYLVRYFLDKGWHVQALQQDGKSRFDPRATYIPFDLNQISGKEIVGADILLHAAYQPLVGKKYPIDINFEAAKKLVGIAHENKIKFIFLSTLSAHGEAESRYGKGKLQAERLFDPSKDLILKLGFVLGEGGGLFGRIKNVLASSKIIPLLGGEKRIQTIALSDIPPIIENAIDKDLTGIFHVAHPRDISMRELYDFIAKSMGKKPFYVPLPIYCSRIIENFGIRLPFSSENLLGLRRLRVFDTENDVTKFGFVLRDYRAALGELSDISKMTSQTENHSSR